MAENIMECGETGSNMEKDCSSAKKKVAGKKEFGTKANESDGFQNNLLFLFKSFFLFKHTDSFMIYLYKD